MSPATLLASALLSLSPALPSTAAQSSDWPHFGGPNRDNRVPALDTKYEWGAGGPKVLWRVATTGPGYGGAAVKGDEVFLLDCELGEMDVLRVLALADGSERWSEAYEAKGRLAFPGSRSVPAVTDDAVYTAGGFGHVACFDRASREIRWSEHLQETYGGEDPGFGWSASPLVLDEVVVFAPLGDDVGLLALDKKTGEERWVSEPVGYSHSTPALLTLLGEPQILVLATPAQGTGNEQASPMVIASVDPSDGSTKWRETVTLTGLPIPGAVQVDGERFLVTGGYRGGTKLFSLAKKDGGYALAERFSCERGAQVHLPLLHGEHVYLLANENWNQENRARRAEGGLLCLGLDGKERWRTGDAPNFGRGNALLAGDHLLIQDGFDGTLRVVRASPEGYRQVAEAKLFGDVGRDGQMWAPMALAGTKLLLRSQEELVCVQL